MKLKNEDHLRIIKTRSLQLCGFQAFMVSNAFSEGSQMPPQNDKKAMLGYDEEEQTPTLVICRFIIPTP